MRTTTLALLICGSLIAAGAARADDAGDVRLTVYGRGWTATPTIWSDGHTTIIVVPDADAAPGAAPAQAPVQLSDATMAINRYITQSGRDCAIDGALHAVGAEITGSRAGWVGTLKCK